MMNGLPFSVCFTLVYVQYWTLVLCIYCCRFVNNLMMYVTYLLNVLDSKQCKTCCFLYVQAGVQVLLDITESHVSALSREELNAVQDLLWLFFCQKLINVRNDCCQVSCPVILYTC